MSGDRYISQNALITEIAKIHGNLSTKNVGQAIWDTPTADVAPRAEIEQAGIEAVKEFAQRLRNYYSDVSGSSFSPLIAFHISEIEREMCAKLKGGS